MPEADKFMSDGVGNGFSFCLTKVDVSGFDYWTSLGGWSKVNEPSSDALKAQSIADSFQNAMKLYFNYNGHSIDVDLGGIRTLTLDIDQYVWDGGSVTVPFEPKDRACRSGGWNAFIETYLDGDGDSADTEVGILPRKMYNGSTDNEDNFVGYGVVNGGGSAIKATNINGAFRFFFSSYVDNEEPTASWTFEYSEAIEEGMWFVASAEANSGSTSIDELEATFSGTTITFKDFDFYTY
jgi:hypothetical protein